MGDVVSLDEYRKYRKIKFLNTNTEVLTDILNSVPPVNFPPYDQLHIYRNNNNFTICHNDCKTPIDLNELRTYIDSVYGTNYFNEPVNFIFSVVTSLSPRVLHYYINKPQDKIDNEIIYMLGLIFGDKLLIHTSL